jgi:hypothetical protein
MVKCARIWRAVLAPQSQPHLARCELGAYASRIELAVPVGRPRFRVPLSVVPALGGCRFGHMVKYARIWHLVG